MTAGRHELLFACQSGAICLVRTLTNAKQGSCKDLLDINANRMGVLKKSEN
jgi:hypothetical protein